MYMYVCYVQSLKCQCGHHYSLDYIIIFMDANKIQVYVHMYDHITSV